MKTLNETMCRRRNEAMLSREVREEIRALRSLAADLAIDGDIASVEIVLTFADLFAYGYTWSSFLDDVEVRGAYRQHVPAITIIH